MNGDVGDFKILRIIFSTETRRVDKAIDRLCLENFACSNEIVNDRNQQPAFSTLFIVNFFAKIIAIISESFDYPPACVQHMN